MCIFQYLFTHVVCTNIFGAIFLKPRFKIDAVIMIICSIVIIINSVLTLQVSTTLSSTLDSLHTGVSLGHIGARTPTVALLE